MAKGIKTPQTQCLSHCRYFIKVSSLLSPSLLLLPAPFVNIQAPRWGGLAPDASSSLLSLFHFRLLGELSCLIWLISKPSLDDVNN